MSNRWDKLSREFGLPAENPAADKNRVLEQVFARVSIAPESSRHGRVIFVSKKFKTALIALLVLALSSGTVLAASHFGLLDGSFKGDTSYLEGAVQTPNTSVTDGRFTLTVEEYLVGESQVMVLFAVKAETADALAELTATDERGRDTFWDMDTLSFYAPDTDNMVFSSWGLAPYPEMDTEDTQHYILTTENMDNPERLPVVLRLNKMAEPNSITLDMTPNITTKSFKLSDDLSININAIGLNITKHYAAAQQDIIEPEVFFRSTAGDIITNYQIYDIKTGSQDDDKAKGGVNITNNFIAKTIVDPETLASIIIDGTEYSLADGRYLGEAQIPAELKAFIVNGYLSQDESDYGVPLDEIAVHVGADWQFDAATGQAMMTYRDTTVKLTAGSTTAVINGREIDLTVFQAPEVNEAGHFIVYDSNITDSFDINLQMYGDWGDWLENGKRKPISDVIVRP